MGMLTFSRMRAAQNKKEKKPEAKKPAKSKEDKRGKK